MKCNKDADTPKLMQIDATDRCNPKIVYDTKSGCPVVSAGAWIVFLAEYPWILSIILIVFGAVATFRGRKFFDRVIGIIGGGLAFLIAMLFFSAVGMVDYLDPSLGSGNIWYTLLAFILAAGIAVAVGYLLCKLALTVGILALGLIGGFFLGVLIYNTLFSFASSLWVLYGIAFFCAIVLGFLSYTQGEKIKILGTSFIGSYAFIRGISILAGHFPNEIFIQQQLSAGYTPTFDWQFYVYLASIGVLFVMGAVWQFKEQEAEEVHDGYTKVDG